MSRARSGTALASRASAQRAAAEQPPPVSARIVPLAPGFYVFRLASETGWHEPLIGLALPAVQVSVPPEQEGAVEITDDRGRAETWLGGQRSVLFVAAPQGGTALVT